jgi:hypothetical protein
MGMQPVGAGHMAARQSCHIIVALPRANRLRSHTHITMGQGERLSITRRMHYRCGEQDKKRILTYVVSSDGSSPLT